MLPALSALKGLIKQKSYHIDHVFFRLHYQATVGLLLAFCLILTAKVLFGDVIDCQDRVVGRDNYYDNWCYSRGTTTEYVPDIDAYESAVKDYYLKSTMNGTQLKSLAYRVADAKPPAQTTTEASWLASSLDKIGEVGLRVFFDQTNPPVPEAVTPENKEQLENYYSMQPPFSETLLKGTALGDILKAQFKNIHSFVRNSGVKVSPDIRYMIPGVSVPRGRAEKYLLTFHHTYYQYIPVILFLQAIFFYFPHYLWKCWENGVVSSICKQLHDHRFSPSDFIESNYHLVDYLQNAFFVNKMLVYKYYCCHLLLLANLIAQVLALNVIFNNQFITYGLDVIQYFFIDENVYGLRDYFTQKPEDLNNPMDFVYPKVTNCRYLNLGDGGSPNELYFACVLPLNMFHDKFFLILWFWFLGLIFLTVAQIVFDIMYATLPALRKYLFIRRFGPTLMNTDGHPSSLPELFLLDLIGNNSDKFAFSALLKKLNKEDWNPWNSAERHSWV